MNNFKIVAILFFMYSGAYSYSQTPTANLHTKNKKSISSFHEAELLQQQRKWNEAISLLDAVIQKDTAFVEAYLKVGTLYMTMGNKTAARRYFSKASDLYPSVKSFAGAYYTAGELNYNEGAYEKAKRYFQLAINVQSTDKKIVEFAPRFIERCDFAINLINHPVDFKPVLLGPPINTLFSQSHPVLTADRKTMYFTTLTGMARQDNEDIVMTTNVNGVWSEPKSISSNINTTANEGTCSISMDGNSLVFVGCGKPDGLGSCDIYISNKLNGVWSTPVNLGPAINSSTWDSHPSLSADGRTLYFVSARKGGFGKEDIYISHLNDKDEWMPAFNAGPSINTPGTEFSPFIHADGTTLYFSSNGWMGLGGLDIFYTSGADTSWAIPKNLGYPLNTNLNDETLFITVDGKKGYYSRFKGESINYNSGILMYEFDVPDSFKPEKTSTFAQGHIYDKVTKKALGARVELIDISSGVVSQSILSDSITGEYTIVITEGKEYALYVNRKQYLFESLNFDYKKEKSFNPLTLDVYLTPIKAGSRVTLNNIFFATNSYELEEKSLVELNKLINFININPKQPIELSGYTDNIGSTESNMKLSMMRAKAVYDYLISKGVKSTFISYKGYGATNPVADNTSEEGRQKNRRLEIKVL
ncbi:OmpA family protein [uncultured Cytophaga sp.]|uniref:OmpA family protein n=1 Tax=uncultured Cytophaga sp. TaxID=160238 RepID=UPI0026150948|nr:OmpA family protein [uncultured Cytophaga sp.]